VKTGWRQSNLSIFKSISAVFNKGIRAKADRQSTVQGSAQAKSSLAEHEPKEMSLVEHLMDLRKHLVRSLGFFLGFTIVAIIFMEPLIKFLRTPFEAYQLSKGKTERLMSTALFEVILMNFKVCIIIGIIAAVPFILREIWLFVSPALYENERKMARPILLSSLALFYTGVSFGFFLIVPAFLSNTLEWAAPYADVHLTVESYFSSLSVMVMIFGIIFEVPVILSLLGLVGILKSEHLTKNRRIVILVSFIIGAIISPPDVFSQFVVSIPLYLMVEISVIALRIIEKKKANALPKETV
jgi:sec-independent protein translocase protein TatC